MAESPLEVEYTSTSVFSSQGVSRRDVAHAAPQVHHLLAPDVGGTGRTELAPLAKLRSNSRHGLEPGGHRSADQSATVSTRVQLWGRCPRDRLRRHAAPEAPRASSSSRAARPRWPRPPRVPAHGQSGGRGRRERPAPRRRPLVSGLPRPRGRAPRAVRRVEGHPVLPARRRDDPERVHGRGRGPLRGARLRRRAPRLVLARARAREGPVRPGVPGGHRRGAAEALEARRLHRARQPPGRLRRPLQRARLPRLRDLRRRPAPSTRGSSSRSTTSRRRPSAPSTTSTRTRATPGIGTAAPGRSCRCASRAIRCSWATTS